MIGFLALSVVCLAGGRKPPSVTAAATLKVMEQRAKVEHKNVLVIFHASWCVWCHKLEKFMDDPKFKPVFESNYEVMTVDVDESHEMRDLETPGGAELSTQLGAGKQGLPFFAALSPAGKVLMDSRNPSNIGFPSEPGEVAYFVKFLKTTAPHVKPEQLEMVKAFLSAKKKS